MREAAVLEPGEEDHRELQPLGRVQGHQGDLTEFGIGNLIRIRGQGHLFEELVDGRGTDARSGGGVSGIGVIDVGVGCLGGGIGLCIGRTCGGGRLGAGIGNSVCIGVVGTVRLRDRGGLSSGDEVLGHGDELGEVVDTGLVLRVGALLQ